MKNNTTLHALASGVVISLLMITTVLTPIAAAWAPVNPESKPYTWSLSDVYINQQSQTAFGKDMSELNWVTAYYDANSTLVFFGEGDFDVNDNGEGSSAPYGRLCRFYNTWMGSPPGCNDLNTNYSLPTTQIYEYNFVSYEPDAGSGFEPADPDPYDASFEYVITGQKVDFRASASDNEAIVRFLWSFDDGVTFVNYNPTDATTTDENDTSTAIYSFEFEGEYISSQYLSYTFPTEITEIDIVMVAIDTEDQEASDFAQNIAIGGIGSGLSNYSLPENPQPNAGVICGPGDLICAFNQILQNLFTPSTQITDYMSDIFSFGILNDSLTEFVNFFESLIVTTPTCALTLTDVDIIDGKTFPMSDLVPAACSQAYALRSSFPMTAILTNFFLAFTAISMIIGLVNKLLNPNDHDLIPNFDGYDGQGEGFGSHRDYVKGKK